MHLSPGMVASSAGVISSTQPLGVLVVAFGLATGAASVCMEMVALPSQFSEI